MYLDGRAGGQVSVNDNDLRNNAKGSVHIAPVRRVKIVYHRMKLMATCACVYSVGNACESTGKDTGFFLKSETCET